MAWSSIYEDSWIRKPNGQQTIWQLPIQRRHHTMFKQEAMVWLHPVGKATHSPLLEWRKHRKNQSTHGRNPPTNRHQPGKMAPCTQCNVRKGGWQLCSGETLYNHAFWSWFNNNNKWLGCMVMQNMEWWQEITLERYDSHNWKAAGTQCLNKRLFYNYIWAMHIPAALCSNDAKSCYNRIILLIAALCFCRLGAPLPAVVSMTKALAQLRYHVWSAYYMPAVVPSTPQCSWTPLVWNYNNLGHAHLAQLPADTQLQLSTTDLTRQSHTLKINKPSDAICLLGDNIAADRNYLKELNVLKQKQNKYVQFLLWTPLTHCITQVISKQCYIPTVTYPLPGTTMPPTAIHATQCTVTSLFLMHMGYPCHLPQYVIYAPETLGGLGLWHLRQEQGVQQTLQLLWHLWANTTNRKLYAMMINQYQIYAGM